MERLRVSTVITDLDDTLFDWVDIWHRSFKAMLDCLVEQSGIPKDTLEREFKAVHQRHGTSEYAFSIQELPSLLERFPGEDLPSKFGEAIHRYNKARKEALALYPGVRETLQTLKANGCVVVGYTESMAFYSNRRVKKLGLDGLLDYIYSPKDHDLPAGLSLEDPRLQLTLDTWKQTVQVQQHFNDLELRIRNFAITLLLASLGAAGIAMKEGMKVPLGHLSWALPLLAAGLGASALLHFAERKLMRWFALAGGLAAAAWAVWQHEVFAIGNPPLASLILLAGLLGWSGCYFMDRWWYHRLLYGAVRQGLYIEERLREVLPEASLTKAIGDASPFQLGAHHVRSSEKIDWFYGVVALVLCLGAIVLWTATPATEPSSSTTPHGLCRWPTSLAQELTIHSA